MRTRNNNSPLIAGAIVIGIGVLILLKQMHLLQGLTWLFNWKTLLITIGVISGAKRNFAQPYSWLIPIGIGSLFLLGDITNIHLVKYIIPIIIISVGLIMILNATSSNKWLEDFSRKNNNADNNYQDLPFVESEYGQESTESASEKKSKFQSSDSVSMQSFFSGNVQVLTTKAFQGGAITAVMGGADLNLMQADMQSPALIDLMVMMGGVKILVPPTWQVKSEVLCLFGGIEDRRPVQVVDTNAVQKILVLKGTAIMGGVEIKSY